jgi:hypothetical protein
MKYLRIIGLFTAVFVFCHIPLQAQISQGGTPVSFDKLSLSTVESVITGPVDVQAFLAEDEIEREQGLPFRFGAPFDVNYNIYNSGTWDELAAGRFWRLRIESPGAFSINLIYDYFFMPPGAKMFVYSEDRQMVLGAFTEHNNKDHGQFSTAPVKGDVCIVEYYEPAEVRGRGVVAIGRIVHAYRDIFNYGGTKRADGYGSSGSCNNNVHCPEGLPWKNEKRAVAMTLLADGTRWCSGVLVNNVRQDKTPLFLTARHCFLGGPENWIFMFNYESPTCSDADGPTHLTVQGSVTHALYNYSDCLLLELLEQPPDSYNVFFAGWSNADIPSQSSTGIHHPSCDVKKISFDYDSTVSSGWGSENGSTHWMVGNWEDGTTEPGSSGSPLFDQNHRIVGQLSGGVASCTVIGADYYGKIAESWEGGGTYDRRLKDWLDPDNTGATVLDGFDPDTGIFIWHTPPQVTHDTITDYEITCIITSDTDILLSSLILRYGILAEWDDSQLSPTGNQDEYHGYLPSQSAGTTIDYFLVAADESGSADTTDTFSLYVDYSAAISVNPNALSDSVTAGDSMAAEIIIVNSGNTDLAFVVEIQYEIGFGWLTINKAFGSPPPGGSDTLQCLLASAGLDTAIYMAAIVIASNDPDPEDNPVIVPVEMVVFEPLPDTDGDGIADMFDNCPADHNPSQQDSDHDGYGDACDLCMGFDDTQDSDGDGIPDGCDYVCGDANGDEQVNIGDAVFIIAYVFKGGPPPEPLCPGDANGDGQVNIGDAVYLIAYVFKGGPPPNEDCCP